MRLVCLFDLDIHGLNFFFQKLNDVHKCNTETKRCLRQVFSYSVTFILLFFCQLFKYKKMKGLD